MKLTRGKLLETIRRKNEGATTYQARKIAGISIRRVNQVWHAYTISGVLPEIGKTIGRPSIKVSQENAQKSHPKKDWIRYERRHSLTAIHIDWHYYEGGIGVFAVNEIRGSSGPL